MYQIEFEAEAVKTLRRLPRNVARLIRTKIDQLAEDPHAPNHNVKRLRGDAAYRLRVGDWRVLYLLEDTRLVITVIKIRPRGSAYD
jgi:mRNA interferase RelE/StbE